TAKVENSFANATVAGVSHDGSTLLALVQKDSDSESGYELWIIPILAGQFHRVGAFMVDSAAFFPDDRIVFTQTNESQTESNLFIVSQDGLSPRRLISLKGTCYPGISPGVQRILLDRYVNGIEMLDEIAPDGTNFKELLKFGQDDCCYTWG